MAEPYARSLFLFRRDLRLDDNTGLLQALELSEEVLAAFVFDPRQQPQDNDYFSLPAFQFLVESLEDLAGQLEEHSGRLHLFHGLPTEVLEELIDEAGVEAVFVNRDYTPFSRRRDAEIRELCARRQVYFEDCSDLLLHEPGTVLTQGGDPYQTFTPFYRNAREREVPPVRRLSSGTFLDESPPGAATSDLPRRLLEEAGGASDDLHVHGGRSRALELLERVGELTDYAERRDVPAEDGTTSLSAHLKFGTVSVREVRQAMIDALGDDAGPVVRELHWRDFFTHLAWFHPYVFGGSFQEKYDAVEWDDDDELFDAWCLGKTGFPIVDAGMRQLEATGWMHNRVRMIVASFLTKDLHLDWRRGERHFARKLVDYDPCVNNGNWQWAASTGADAQPYFRIFNPWSQQKKFDPDGDYIRRWVPELADVEPRDLHRLHEQRPLGLSGYPQPIVDHKEEREEALDRFKAVG